MSKVESLASAHSFPPEFRGDLSYWQQDIQTLQEALNHPEGYEFEARLPEIVGYLNEADIAEIDRLPQGMKSFRRLFDNYSDDDREFSLVALRERFPHMLAIIDGDMSLVTDGKFVLNEAEVEKAYTEAGKRPRIASDGEEDVHVDRLRGTKEGVSQPTYLISDFEPTRFYSGPATLYKNIDSRDPDRVMPLRLRQDGLDQLQVRNMVAAPPYAIVRASGATVHESPVFTEAGMRTFFRA